MDGGGADPTTPTSSSLNPVAVVVGIPVVATSGALLGLGRSCSSGSLVADGLDVGASERSAPSCGPEARLTLGRDVGVATGTAVGSLVSSLVLPLDVGK